MWDPAVSTTEDKEKEESMRNTWRKKSLSKRLLRHPQWGCYILLFERLDYTFLWQNSLSRDMSFVSCKSDLML